MNEYDTPGKTTEKRPRTRRAFVISIALCVLVAAGAICVANGIPSAIAWPGKIMYGSLEEFASSTLPFTRPAPKLDVFGYNQRMIALAGYGTTSAKTGISATSTAWTSTTTSISSPLHRWPVPTVYPLASAILPFSRIVGYYGNFYSAQMGILGEYEPDAVANKLTAAIVEWQAADPTTPVIPAVDYIAVVAQGSAGADGKYRFRMPSSQIDKALAIARSMHGLLFIDIQPGLSTLQDEIPLFEPYLQMPDVHLAIDPEFSMKDGSKPGTRIGTMSAADINYASGYLASIVDKYHLPPKVLVVHRFTENMITNYQGIAPLPETQIVISMDGWGPTDKKIGTYQQVITPEPVQFSGIKLFYKNDSKPPSTGLLTATQVYALHPAPIFIEYQ